MRRRVGWLVVVTCSVAMAGCRKSTSAPSGTSASQPDQVDAAASASAQVRPEAAPATSKTLDGEVEPYLTSQLRLFAEQNGRLPTDFAELARTRLDLVPRTPPGTTWAIDRVTQEVKLVKK